MIGILLAATLISSCATHGVDPSRVGISLREAARVCTTTVESIPVLLEVSNNGPSALRLGIQGTDGPPFKVSWLYYNVLTGIGGGDIDYKHGPGDHGPSWSSTLKIGPGDTTTVSATLYEVGPEDHATIFRIQLEDLDRNIYVSMPFKPCIGPRTASGAAPGVD